MAIIHRVKSAKYGNKCVICGRKINVGDPYQWASGSKGMNRKYCDKSGRSGHIIACDACTITKQMGSSKF